MSGLMDEATLRAAFAQHAIGQTHFTRRMAIILADMDGTSVRPLIRRLERIGLLKDGSWEWFVQNGGISREQIDQVRREVRAIRTEMRPSHVA